MPRDQAVFNDQMVNASLLPRDKQGIWVLDFAFKPLRIRTVDIPGKGRRQIHYLYYKVVNRTGKPRMFVPQFIMVNENGKRFEDEVIPEAIPSSRSGKTPRSRSWARWTSSASSRRAPSRTSTTRSSAWPAGTVGIRKSDRFSIYVRGLSDGYKEFPPESGGKPVAKYKTLRIDFIRRGDEHNLNEKEIQLADPPYEWVYW